MNYAFRFSESGRRDLYEATVYYFGHHPEAGDSAFQQLVTEQFAKWETFPEAAPLSEYAEHDGQIYRRVVAWHFVFLFRVDEPKRILIIDAVYHERADR